MRVVLIWLSLPGASQQASEQEPRLGPFEKPRPHPLIHSTGNQNFTAYEALNGATATQEDCAGLDPALWVSTADGAACMRYYSHGLAASNKVVLVYLSGDVILRTAKGVRFVSPAYISKSPESLTTEMAAWSEQAGAPTVYLARPGIYGSSGDHNLRRRKAEVDLLDAALDRLRERYSIENFILVGHSGGGHLAAALLNRRSDIKAMVSSSGMLAVKRAMITLDRQWKIHPRLLYDVRDFYDPVDDVEQIRKNPRPRIFILSDPEDRSVPFYSQLYYVKRLRGVGQKPVHIYAQATDKAHHVLVDQARLIAAMLAQDATDREIRRAVSDFESARSGL
ncbi:alpha/beta fold hydrolase [Salmonella enterica subsp. enterica]|nr:alpha/beta fold hydrolase [Salmonella enterica subsp. enterica]